MKKIMWIALATAVLAVFAVVFAVALPAFAAPVPVTVSLMNTQTGNTLWQKTFDVPSGTYTIDVPTALLTRIMNAFGTTAFSPGSYTTQLGVNQLTITVPVGLEVIFVQRSLPETPT